MTQEKECRAAFEKSVSQQYPHYTMSDWNGVAKEYTGRRDQQDWMLWQAAWQAALNSRTTTPDPIFLCNDTPEVK